MLQLCLQRNSPFSGGETRISFTEPKISYNAALSGRALVLKQQCHLGLGTVLFMLHLFLQHSFHTPSLFVNGSSER